MMSVKKRLQAHGELIVMYADSGAGPGGLITALAGDSDPDTAPTNTSQIYDYTASSVTLAANTAYWVVFGTNSADGPAADDYWVGYDRTPAETGTDLGRPYGSTDQGANWVQGGYPVAHPNDRVSMVVTVIPEPSGGLMLALGGLLALSRRRR